MYWSGLMAASSQGWKSFNTMQINTFQQQTRQLKILSRESNTWHPCMDLKYTYKSGLA